MCDFEKKVYENLKNCGVSFEDDGAPLAIGAAVSGGADSISLLVSLSKILSELKAGGKSSPESLFVITVNHNIRPAEESGGDARYVIELCQKLEKECGLKICCKLVELEAGAVAAEAEKRGRGTEDAARCLRYNAFEDFIAEHDLSALCLAHNRNDQLETVLMRFLQGASFDSAGGIKARRGSFVRPLLNIARTEIEAYLTAQKIGWRTDKTNYETDYLRNKIRLKLVPLLNENFDGWQTGVLNGAEKALEDSEFIKSCLENIELSEASDGSIQLSLSDFSKAPESIKYRLLLEACNRAGEQNRIPRQFLKDVITSLASAQNTSFTKHFSDIDIIKEKNKLFIKKASESNTDLVFSDIIEKNGTFEFPFGILSVFNCVEQDGKITASVCAGKGSIVENVSLPFCVRSVQSGDTVLCADGSEKKVSDIISDWHLAADKRALVPVIQILNEKSQRIKAVLAGFLGYKDWIVKL